MSTALEFRTLIFPSELRVQRAEGAAPQIVGFAARYNKLSEDLGGWREMIAPGAFDGVMKDDVRMLRNHDPNWLLGRVPAGTLKLESRAEGLWMECTPPDTDQARAVMVSIERADTTGQSFSFALPPMPEGRVWEEDENGNLTRTVTKIARLYDVGPVTYPAYPDTDAAVRSSAAAANVAILAEARAMLKGPTRSLDVLRRRLDLAAAAR